jgi:hypothetical protein
MRQQEDELTGTLNESGAVLELLAKLQTTL